MNKIEEKAIKWLLSEGKIEPRRYSRYFHRSPDIETDDGRGYEIKTCNGSKYFWDRRNEPGTILFSSLKQWHELKNHPNCKILVFGEGKEPIAIIPISELPIGLKQWKDIHFRIAKQFAKGYADQKEKWLVAESQAKTDRERIRLFLARNVGGQLSSSALRASVPRSSSTAQRGGAR